MANPTTGTIVVPVVADIEPLIWQLVVFKDLLHEVSNSLDTAIRSLQGVEQSA